MRCLITGAAGFIGSHVAERLVELGHDVIGVDSFISYYDPASKRRNIAALSERPNFRMVELDLSEANLAPLVDGADWVFHLAGQPGVRGSWGNRFAEYLQHNVQVTQRLLEALRVRPPLRLIYASSSSVYGDAPVPMREDMRPLPVSPYGVTKLAGEHLARVYWQSYGVPAVSLRFFTAYGPRQRPDMAFHRFVRAIADGKPVQLYGDGHQTRDFTYVADVVEACLRAATCDCAGEVINVGGGASVTVSEVLERLGGLIGQPVHVEYMARPHGDAPHTSASTDRAVSLLDWRPAVPLAEGLRRQVEWQLGAVPLRRRAFAAPRGEPRNQGPRLLIYGHDTYGLGHLRRNLTIASALTREMRDLSILLVTGSPAAQHFALPPNVDYVKLPEVIKVADEDYRARTLRMQPAEIVQMRAALVRETVCNFGPDAVLVDHAPVGMKGELLPALQALREHHPTVRVALGLRDIIDEPRRVVANWAEHGIYRVLERNYDSILVYGVPQVMDVVAAYHLSPTVAAKTQYCGYLPRTRAGAVPDQATIRAAYCGPDERLVIVTAGGGGDGYLLLSTYLAALGTPEASAHIVSVIVTGPFLPAAERAELESLAASRERVHLVEFTDDMLGLMEAADLVVCMGGYNTLCEVLSVNARALVVPRTEPRREQLLRAMAFEQLGLISMEHSDTLAPTRLARRVSGLLDDVTSTMPGRECDALATFAASGGLGGLDATVRAITELIQQSQPAGVAASRATR
jgi:predicted glycosyltransferase/nucleoside-diphosphate-sugar epimerase